MPEPKKDAAVPKTNSDAAPKVDAVQKTNAAANADAGKNANEKIGEKPVANPAQKPGPKEEIRQQPPQTQGNENGGLLGSPIVPMILVFVVMIFFMHRANKKQTQKRQEMIDKLTKGTKVLLTSGIYGTVDAVHEDSLIVEIATGVKIKVAKAGVAGLDTPETEGKAEGK